MKNLKANFTFQIILTLVFGLLPLSQVAANSGKDAFFSARKVSKAQNLIAKDLSQKLRSDLSENNLSVKLTNLEESKTSNSLVEIKGAAFCVFTADQAELPLTFEAKYNPVNDRISDIRYVFVETSESSFAPSNDEEMLMKTLMKQISVDYKTEQITIAIDNFETSKVENGNTKFTGTGEVKIGQMVWNRVNFDVVANDVKSPTQVKYEIK